MTRRLTSLTFFTEKVHELFAKLKQVGPALVLAAVVLGPGSITLSTIAGAQYGYRMLWVLVISTVFMIGYTLMAAKIGLVTRMTLFEATRCRYGNWLARLGGIFGFLSILSFQAGNSAAVGFAGNALLGTSTQVATAIGFVLAALVILTPDLYRRLELLVKVVVGLMIVGFAGTLALVGVDPGGMAAGLVPSFPDADSIFLALGMSATTFSIAAAAFQNHLMKQKRWGMEELLVEGLDTFIGIAILGGISAMVLLTSAGVLFGSGETTFSAQAMAMQLEPLAGPGAFYLFTIGFFLAAFSSLVVNPIIGATLLVDGFGRDTRMESRAVRIWSLVALAFGFLVILLFNRSPIELLRLAQALAVVAFPILGFLVWSLSRDRRLMGRHANSIWMDVVAILGYLTIVGIVLNYLRQISG